MVSITEKRKITQPAFQLRILALACGTGKNIFKI